MSIPFLVARRSHMAKEIMHELLASAGITVGGDAPHDLKIHDERFYARALRDGRLGLGESYMEGWWDAAALDQAMCRMLEARLDERVRESPRLLAHAALSRLLNLQAPSRAHAVGERHYDISNDLYRAMLDQRMVYTCGYWKDAADLDAAQEAKLDLVCRKLGLRAGMRVLDIGCGWGSFARFAAERYGVQVVGLTVSREQVELGRELCAGLPVDIRHQDYRQAHGTYDAVVSIGMMEHVGPRNHRAYMDVVDRCLAPGGVALVHTIANNVSRRAGDPWFHRYIFPNAQVPCLTQLSAAMEGRFVIEDVQNIGPHYDRTLMAWHANVEAAWERLGARFDEGFRRKWRYYLLSSAAAFRSRTLQVHQILFTRQGTPQPETCRAS